MQNGIKHRSENAGGMAVKFISPAYGGRDRIIKGIEEIDILKERYRQAMEYMAWFLPAWEELSEDERHE